jgi:hypothetical protein
MGVWLKGYSTQEALNSNAGTAKINKLSGKFPKFWKQNNPE